MQRIAFFLIVLFALIAAGGAAQGATYLVKPDGTGDFPVIMAAWIAGGFVCVLGALCFAELGVMYPKAGGLYVFLKEAFGRPVAFLFGWSEFVFGRPASIATRWITISVSRSPATKIPRRSPS